MTARTTNPRGPVMWTDWRTAKPGTRVEHVRTGAQGTFARWPITPRGKNPGYAVIDWDTGHQGRVVAYAFDLREVAS